MNFPNNQAVGGAGGDLGSGASGVEGWVAMAPWAEMELARSLVGGGGGFGNGADGGGGDGGDGKIGAFYCPECGSEQRGTVEKMAAMAVPMEEEEAQVHPGPTLKGEEAEAG